MQLTAGLLDGIEHRPGMYGLEEGSYDMVVAYLLGLDHGSGGGVLAGFQELVELKFGATSPVVWPALVPKLEPRVDSDQDRLARLFELLREYVNVDLRSGGRRRLYHEWVVMAQGMDHYRSDMYRFGESPAPTTMSLAEAAEALASDREGVMTLIGRGDLRCGRQGGEVRVIGSGVDRLRDQDADRRR